MIDKAPAANRCLRPPGRTREIDGFSETSDIDVARRRVDRQATGKVAAASPDVGCLQECGETTAESGDEGVSAPFGRAAGGRFLCPPGRSGEIDASGEASHIDVSSTWVNRDGVRLVEAAA